MSQQYLLLLLFNFFFQSSLFLQSSNKHYTPTTTTPPPPPPWELLKKRFLLQVNLLYSNSRSIFLLQVNGGNLIHLTRYGQARAQSTSKPPEKASVNGLGMTFSMCICWYCSSWFMYPYLSLTTCEAYLSIPCDFRIFLRNGCNYWRCYGKFFAQKFQTERKWNWNRMHFLLGHYLD